MPAKHYTHGRGSLPEETARAIAELTYLEPGSECFGGPDGYADARSGFRERDYRGEQLDEMIALVVGLDHGWHSLTTEYLAELGYDYCDEED